MAGAKPSTVSTHDFLSLYADNSNQYAEHHDNMRGDSHSPLHSVRASCSWLTETVRCMLLDPIGSVLWRLCPGAVEMCAFSLSPGELFTCFRRRVVVGLDNQGFSAASGDARQSRSFPRRAAVAR